MLFSLADFKQMTKRNPDVHQLKRRIMTTRRHKHEKATMDPRAGYYGASPPGGYSGGGSASPSPSLDSVDMTPPVSPAQQNYNANNNNNTSGMRRRHAGQTQSSNNGRYGQPDAADDKYRKSRRVVRRLDMFPKVQEDYQVRTDRGGLVTLVGYGLALILVLAEVANWSAERGRVVEHTFVDTR